jgi:hypothetical protein
MSAPPLGRQIAAVESAVRLLKTGGRPARPAERDFMVRDLEAATTTLRWLQTNETQIKAACGGEGRGDGQHQP